MADTLPDATCRLPAFGIDLMRKGGCGSIHSDLHEPNESPEAKMCFDTLESLILAHFVAGVDVATPAYLEGIETAVEAVTNNVPC